VKQQKVFTQDIDNFWVAFDSIQTTKDSIKQINFIQASYIDKGTSLPPVTRRGTAWLKEKV
jgi:hypothetical protein